MIRAYREGLKISNVCGVFKYLRAPLSRAWGIINISGGGGRLTLRGPKLIFFGARQLKGRGSAHSLMAGRPSS